MTQLRLEDFGIEEDVDVLTDAERAVYTAVEYEDTSVRELARQTDRRSDTVSNLLKRAQDFESGIYRQLMRTTRR